MYILFVIFMTANGGITSQKIENLTMAECYHLKTQVLALEPVSNWRKVECIAKAPQ